MVKIEDVIARKYLSQHELPERKRISACNYLDWAIEGAKEAQRWIPVEEELPPVNEPVIVKFIDYKGLNAHWVGVFHDETRMLHFLEQHLKFTHWRPIERR